MMGPKSKKTCFLETMWKDLPASVLEKVFTFLPIAFLCQFRTLSKEWKRTISSSALMHARALEKEYVLITPRRVRFSGGWTVLDTARKRYFTLSTAFLTEHVQRQGLVDAAGAPTLLAAADGGLFCAWCPSSAITWGVYVCNPVLKTVKQLPHTPELRLSHKPRFGPTNSYEMVVMATDRSSMQYEIFIVNNADGVTFKPESILVYESKTGRWRTAFHGPFSNRILWLSLTIFNNYLYFITETADLCRDGLVSFDKETGVVSELQGIDFPSNRASHLVVSNGRLFCVIPKVDLPDDFLSVEISEIDVVRRVSTRLTEMPRAMLLWVFGEDLKRKFWHWKPRWINVATGSADSILIATIVGRCAGYSLSRKSWYQLPDDPTLLEEYCRGNVTREGGIYGSSNCLSHCAP